MSLLWKHTVTNAIPSFDVGDVSGDGIADVALVDSRRWSNEVGYLKILNNDGTMLWTRSFPNKQLGEVNLVDLNSDGQSDVVLAGRVSSSTVYTYLADGSPLWQNGLSTWVDGIAYGNFNNDQYTDVTAGTWGDIRAWNHTGNQLWRYSGTTFSSSPADVGDINGDGLDDVIVATSWKDGRLHVLANDGSLLWRFGSGGYSISGYAANLDGDSKSDVISIATDGFVRGIRSDGTLLWMSPANWAVWFFEESPSRPGAFTNDYNGDSIDDFIYSDGTDQVFVISGTDGSIMTTIHAPSPIVAGAVADVNKDGRLDFVTAGTDDTLYVLDHEGAVIASFYVGEPIDSRGAFPLAIADLDGDEVLDVLAAVADRDIWAIKLSLLVPATVDIAPDTLKLKSKGRWVTCYIELPQGYDADDILIHTIRLESVIAAEFHPTTIGDHDNDGIPDLMVKFSRAELISYLNGQTGYIDLTISGDLVNGMQFSGEDTLRVI
jgi:hypothetical protein